MCGVSSNFNLFRVNCYLRYTVISAIIYLADLPMVETVPKDESN